MEERILSTMEVLNEFQLRVFLANEALSYGYGGIKLVHEISGVSVKTIRKGIYEKKNNIKPQKDRIRKIGGGRKKLIEKNPNIENEIKQIVSSTTYGNPENPLSYTTKSLRKIQKILKEKEYNIGYDTIGKILKILGYSLQANQKMLQRGESHVDRDEQFQFINNKAIEFLKDKEPLISVDCKKKELIGNFQNKGKTYKPIGNPTKVLDHDFLIKELGSVAPYGVYDISKNEGFVNLGTSKDTAEFAVESICRWWLTVGKNTYPNATKVYINCDGGGSNASSNRLFKLKIQEFANQSGLEVHISHFPPGTSKWNKIEHRLFCYISSNWKGQPLIDIKTVVNLIGSTTTTTGLKVKCVTDENTYETGIKVSDKDFAKINLLGEKKFPHWNYIISPNK